jgi:hypothetical protein
MFSSLKKPYFEKRIQEIDWLLEITSTWKYKIRKNLRREKVDLMRYFATPSEDPVKFLSDNPSSSKYAPTDLGEAGVGGVLYEPGGKRILNYYWNIRKDTNNKVEAYALLKGLQLAKTRQILNLNVLGDSKTVIRMMVQGTNPKNLILKRIIDQIRVNS